MQVIRDNSFFRIAWDSFLLLLIFISCALIPYQFVFLHSISWSSSLLIYLIDAVFLVDMGLNFKTSFRTQGIEVLDKQEISRHYLSTSFAKDLLTNFPFDIFIFLIAPDMMLFHVPLVLVFRLSRLFRVRKLFIILKKWEIQAWSHAGYLRIIRFVATILLVIHWVACIWFFSAYIDQFPEDSWVKTAGIAEVSHPQQYAMSLYWTISTMTTVGYGDITAQRPVEYVVAIFVMLLGASMYAFIIGNVASLFSNLDAEKVQYRNRMEAISQYLQYRKVPNQLNAKVINFYEYMWARRRGIDEKQMLIDLPAPLRLEVLLHLTKDLLEKVPLFKYCSPPLRNKLLDSLIPHTYPPNVMVAQEGELGQELFFISKGKLEVLAGKEAETHAILEEGEYFGELSFLMKETRTASVRTLSYCEIFKLKAGDFNEIKKEYPEFVNVIKKMSAEKTEKTTNLILEGVIL